MAPSLNAKNKPSWWARLTRGIAARIDPETYSQPNGGLTFNRFGVTKSVEGRFAEISGSNSMAIERPSGGQIDAAKAMANFKGFPYAATNAKAREVMNIEFRLFSMKGKDPKEIDTHEVLDLLDSVNDGMTGPELKYILSAHLDLTGNAYWYLDGVKGDLDQPKAIYPVDPSKIKVIINKSSWPYQLSGYKFKDGTLERTFEPYEILHFRLPNPSSWFEGTSPMQAAAEYIDNDNYAMEFNRKFFLSGARPAGFLESEAVSESQIDALKTGFEAVHAGIDNMNRIAVLPKGVKWSSAGTSPKDMDFKNLSEDAQDRILAMFGVSRTILGTAESDTNRATAETADYVFSKRVIKPHMQLICSFLNERLIPRYGDDLYISFIDPTPEDRAARNEEMKTTVGGQPVMTVDEAREEYLGLGPVEGGDVLMRPTTVLPANESQDEPEPSKPEPTKTSKSDEGQSSKHLRVAFRPARTKMRKRAEQRKGIAEKLAADIKKVLEGAGKVKKFESSPETDAAKFKEFDERTRKGEKQIAAEVRKINAEQQKEVFANLATAIEKAIDPKDLFDIDKWISITTDAMEPIYISLFEAEARVAAEEIDQPDLDPLDANVRKALHESIAKMATSYQETVRAKLEQVINDGLSNGDSLPDISAKVSEVYGAADDYGAERVAKTEAFRTSNMALKETWKQSGVVKTVRWYNANNPCPFCQQMNGKVISVDSNFLDDGDTVSVGSGDETQTYTADYGAVETPPLHPNCMCFLRPEEVSI